VSVPKAMTIAGSDSGAGAGIQADLKTFAAFGVYGTCAITALTAQNTIKVQGVVEVPADFVALQIDSIMSDINADAVKTGMLANAAIIEAVSDRMKHWRMEKLVVDPVMVAKSGDSLLDPSAVDTLKNVLFPLAYLITPNIPEAEMLANLKISGLEDMQRAAVRLKELGPEYVLVKGGHLRGDITVDILYDGQNFEEFKGKRVKNRCTHGTGCTFSAAITACLAKGATVREAVTRAKVFIMEAIDAGFEVGQGYSPVNHFYEFYGIKRR